MRPRRWPASWVGTRRLVLLCILFAGLLAAWQLGLHPAQLIPDQGGRALVAEFFHGAITPAFSYEADFVPEGTAPLLIKALQAALQTVLLAAAAVSLSIVGGLVLGFCGSTAWWSDELPGADTAARRALRRAGTPTLYAVTRLLIGLMRSTHELLWATLFLCAMGLTPLAAVIAIAIPFTGTFAKIFSEMIDEAPRDSAAALRMAGASPLQVFCFGLLPQAFPDLCSYTMYRFECALRSSAVLGFFGIPTIGQSITLSFENLYYREVWSYIYTLFILVVIVEWWGVALRRRLAE
ncbi:MAG: ABC transporter permease subunit [Planctomycetota bacterium]